VNVRDSHDANCPCFLEQLIPADASGIRPVTRWNTRSGLVQEQGDEEPELIDTIVPSEPILSVAMWCCRNMTWSLVRSAVTLTVSANWKSPPDDSTTRGWGESEDDTTPTNSWWFMVITGEYGL